MGGDYVGGNQTNNYYTMFQDFEREFVVTRNANIKPVYYFTGRETELKELRQRIEEGRKSVLVSGMGGIGKTHICRKLFNEYKDAEKGGAFSHIGYIEYNGDMGSSLRKCLRYKEQENPEANLEAAWKELENLAADGKLLLFVDNVNVSVASDPGLGRLRNIPGAIVLTSRRISFGKEFEPYQIGFLSAEQCREIFERIRYEDSGKRVKEEDVPVLEYIIDKLAARHTITVEHLAHLAWTKRWTVQILKDKLENNGFRLKYIDEEENLINIQESYEALYDLSALSEAEQNILEAFSVFPYIPLAAETCNEWLLADAGVSEDDDILMGLYQKGWLQFDIDQEKYSMHPVFAQFIYEKCRPSLEWHRGLLKECLAKLKEVEWNIFLEIGEEFVLFAEGVAEKLDMGKSEEQIGFLGFVGDFLLKMLKYQDAKKLYEKRIEICEEIFGKYHLDTAKSYSDLAYVYRRWEDREAEKLYEKSLWIRENLLGEEHPDVFENYENLICVYERQGEYEKAERLYKKVMHVQEKRLGEGNPLIINEYYDLANIKIIRGKYGEAETLFVKVICGWGKYDEDRELYIQTMGRSDVSISHIFKGLVSVYVKQGEYEKAQKWFESEWRSVEEVMGEEYPDTAINYSSLAQVYCLREEYKIALSYAFKAYKIFVSKIGINDMATKVNYDIVNSLYTQLHPEGNFEKWLEEQMKE